MCSVHSGWTGSNHVTEIIIDLCSVIAAVAMNYNKYNELQYFLYRQIYREKIYANTKSITFLSVIYEMSKFSNTHHNLNTV